MEKSTKPSYEQGEQGNVPILFYISFGFSFFWMLLLVGLLNNSVAQALGAPAPTLMPTPAALCLGLVVANLATSFKCDYFSTKIGNGILNAMSVIGPLVPSGVLVYAIIAQAQLPMPVNDIAWGIMGLGVGCLLAIWSEILEGFTKKFSSRVAAVSVIIGAILYFMVSNIELPLSICAVCLAAPASLTLQHFLRGEVPPIEFVSRAESLKRHKLTWPIDVLNCLYGAVFGLALCMLSQSLDDVFTFAGIALAATIGGLIMIFVFSKNREKMMHGSVQRKIFPALVIGLLPMPFVDGGLQTLCLLVILVSFVCLVIVDLDALYLLTKKYHVGALYLIGRGQSPIFLGVGLGYLLAFISMSSGAFDSGQLSLISLVLVIALSLSVSFIDFDKDHLEDEREPQGTTPAITEDALGRMPWEAKCAVITEKYDLSTREAEVFTLLARGRGTTYIQEKLFISPHTVKTHVYKIYRKLGINSREELITLVEEEPLDGGAHSEE